MPSLTIYPNPVGDLLNFQVRGEPLAQYATFRVVSLEGKAMWETGQVNVQATVAVSVAGWPAGTYFLQCLENGAVICSEKFVKQ